MELKPSSAIYAATSSRFLTREFLDQKSFISRPDFWSCIGNQIKVFWPVFLAQFQVLETEIGNALWPLQRGSCGAGLRPCLWKGIGCSMFSVSLWAAPQSSIAMCTRGSCLPCLSNVKWHVFIFLTKNLQPRDLWYLRNGFWLKCFLFVCLFVSHLSFYLVVPASWSLTLTEQKIVSAFFIYSFIDLAVGSCCQFSGLLDCGFCPVWGSEWNKWHCNPKAI